MIDSPDPSPAAPLGVAVRTPTAAILARLSERMAWSVPIGPLSLTAQVDTGRAQALVSATLGAQLVARQVLTLPRPVLSFDVAINELAAKGSVTLSIVEPPEYSALAVDVTAAAGSMASIFRGEIASWLAAEAPVLAEFDYPITALLSAHTTVRGLKGDIAELDLVSGTELLDSRVTTMAAPIASFGAIEDGSVTIAAGATIRLTAPSALQAGSLVLVATLPDMPPDSRNIAASVAQWPLP